MTVDFIVTGASKTIHLYLDGNAYTIDKSHFNYENVKEALSSKDYTNILELVDIPHFISHTSKGELVINNQKVYYGGKELHHHMVDRIFDLMNQQFPVDRMLKFLQNLLKNPDQKSVDELYIFLEKCELPLTEDGCFLAYKKVRDDFSSFHECPDGSRLDNSIGSVPEMSREECNPNRHETCSEGLHFCSQAYLPKFNRNQGRVMILKVNPKDVVSIPSDCNDAKGRACKYEVVEEYVSEKNITEPAFTAASVDTQNMDIPNGVPLDVQMELQPDEYGVKPSGNKFYQVRGAGGKFVKKTKS